jgi:hypothetical protein
MGKWRALAEMDEQCYAEQQDEDGDPEVAVGENAGQ